jgi:hypothetical protein
VNKELFIKALDGTDPFFVHDDKLYKKYDRIEIDPHYVDIEKKRGLFKSEIETVYSGIEVSFYYGSDLVIRRVFQHLYLDAGDKLKILELGGLIEVSLNEA